MARSTPKREFYELPDAPTSTDIINAARQHIKAAQTSRPFTPADRKRSLFPNRPTSATSSVDLAEFTGSASGTPRILSPIQSPTLQKRKDEAKKKEKDNFEAYWRAKIAPILGCLTMEVENVDIAGQVEELSECLLRGGFLTGAVALPHSYRVKVFQCLINLLESKDSRLLLKISRVLISLGIYDKSLINISKLIFKLTRSENNDTLFLEERIVHCLLKLISNAKLTEDGQAMVYCIGAVKVLSANTDNNIGDLLGQYGVIQALHRHLITCNTDPEVPPEVGKALLVQILGALRNLCDIPVTEALLEEMDLSLDIHTTLVKFFTDSEVILTCCRLLSRMSLFGGFCEALSGNQDCLKILVKIIDSYPHDAQMLLRSCFILGNVVARYPEPALYLHKNGAIVDSLLSICKEYKGKLAEKVSKDKQSAANKDVLCKAVRLLTNLLQNEEIAVSISPQLIKFLISLGDYSLRSGVHEISLNVLCGFNNMSYYNGEGSIFLKHRTLLTDFLMRFLTVNHSGVNIEALGVLGNLSQHWDVVQMLVDNKHFLTLATTHLEGDNANLVYKACGVLVNVTRTAEFHNQLPKKLISSCVSVLKDVGTSDVELTTVTLYLLWNILSLKVLKASDVERDVLVDVLSSHLETTGDGEVWVGQIHPPTKNLLNLLSHPDSQYEHL